MILAQSRSLDSKTVIIDPDLGQSRKMTICQINQITRWLVKKLASPILNFITSLISHALAIIPPNIKTISEVDIMTIRGLGSDLTAFPIIHLKCIIIQSPTYTALLVQSSKKENLQDESPIQVTAEVVMLVELTHPHPPNLIQSLTLAGPDRKLTPTTSLLPPIPQVPLVQHLIHAIQSLEVLGEIMRSQRIC